MQAIIPDTLEGALILSVIDFFLSFVVISFIGLVLAAFPLLNRLTKTVEKARQVPPKEDRVDMEANDHIIAIAAAVHAMMGAHRIVHIEPAPRGTGWVAEGRAAHHASHAARYAPGGRHTPS